MKAQYVDHIQGTNCAEWKCPECGVKWASPSLLPCPNKCDRCPKCENGQLEMDAKSGVILCLTIGCGYSVRPGEDAQEEQLSEEWLRASGFKWEQLDRQPSKHWLLWLGDACVDREKCRTSSSDFLGIELAANTVAADYFCWLRADYAGRYSRLIHVRHVRFVYEVTTLIEGLTGRPWNPADALYGSLRSPESAAVLREEQKRFDVQLAHEWGKRVEREANLDPDKRELVTP